MIADIDLDFAEEITLDFDEIPIARASNFMLRDYQGACLAAIDEAFRNGLCRILAVLATGAGKTIIFSKVCELIVNAGGRVLILAHTEELLDQAAKKLEMSTGLISEKEKAQHHASLDASVVVASIQTLSKDNRLMAFPDNHFALVIVDEAHRTLANSYLKILNYFHFGECSLAEDWVAPAKDAPFEFKAKVLGVTATSDRGDKRSLGGFYQGQLDEHKNLRPVFEYGLLQACLDGYLVRPVSLQIPLSIDLRKVKVSRSSNGSDFDATELSKRISPFLTQIAQHIVDQAGDRKVVLFLPGIETARLMSEALNAAGMTCQYVTGKCTDRTEKMEWFAAAGPGNAICNAMLLTEGWDCPDVSAICVLRPTKIRGLYCQCVGRGTRPLTGTIDGLNTREERIRAIAQSAKPDLKILDFLWLSDRLDLVESSDLVAGSLEVREAMKKAAAGGQGPIDLINAVELADRDLLKSLERAAKANSKKSARVIDPLKWAVTLGDEQLATYEPQTKWDSQTPTQGQIDLLKRNHIDVEKVTCRGLASKLIDRVVSRQKLGLCTIKQLNFLEQLGVKDAAFLSIAAATSIIDATLAEKRKQRAQDKIN